MLNRFVVAVALAACSGSGRSTSAPHEETPVPAAAPMSCGTAGPCAQGEECVKYYGIAGKAGGEMASCEVRCKADADCPGGKKCQTIADGPGQVCR